MNAKLMAGALAIVASVSLSGCQVFGPSAEEIAYQNDCKSIYEKASTTFEWDEGSDFEFWPERYPVTNAGVQSRATAAAQISLKFPWMTSAIQELEDIHGRKVIEESLSLHVAYARALAIEDLVEGTSFSPIFSDSELTEVKNNPSSLYDLVEPKWLTFIDIYDGEGMLDACSELFEDGWGEGFEERVRDSLSNAEHGAVQMRAILACQERGRFQGDKCAKNDFVMDDTYAPEPSSRDPFLNPYSDETTQGLAEFTWCWNQGLEVNPSRSGCW
jgi:hypothetical protein